MGAEWSGGSSGGFDGGAEGLLAVGCREGCTFCVMWK